MAPEESESESDRLLVLYGNLALSCLVILLGKTYLSWPFIRQAVLCHPYWLPFLCHSSSLVVAGFNSRCVPQHPPNRFLPPFLVPIAF